MTTETDAIRWACSNSFSAEKFDAWLAAHDREIQAQALREAADLRHGTDLTPTTMSLGTDQGWWYEYLQRLDETWRSNLRARAARLTATTEEPK